MLPVSYSIGRRLRGSILARDGEPLATSILRYRVDFDMASEGFDSLEIFRKQADTLSKRLSQFFGGTSASYRDLMLKRHQEHYRLVYRKDSNVLRSEGWFDRIWDAIRNDQFKTVKIYDTLRDHSPVEILPRAVDYNEWQELKKYPILNWNLGMTYRLVTLDQRVYPYGELGRRTLGLVGDKGNYGIEAIYRETLEGRNGCMLRQRIAPGFSSVVHSNDNVDAEDGLDIVTTLDVDIQHAADAALRRRMSRVVKMAVSTAVESLGGVAEIEQVDAILTATGWGCLADSEKFLRNLITEQEQFLNPTPFIQSTFNTVGGQIALLGHNHGYNMTYVNRGHSFEDALLDGMMRLADGESKRILLGAFDELTPTVERITERMGWWRNHQKGEGAAFMTLTAEREAESVARVVKLDFLCEELSEAELRSRYALSEETMILCCDEKEVPFYPTFAATRFVEAVRCIEKGAKEVLLYNKCMGDNPTVMLLQWLG